MMMMARRRHPLRRINDRVLVLALLPLLALVGVAVVARQWAPRAETLAIVHRSPHCHCCAKWVSHLERSGFKVETRFTDSLADVRARLGVAPASASCHTAIVGSLVIEGHVPAQDIRRALGDSSIAGLAVPGMPQGSPGMEGARVTPYDVLAWRPDGTSFHYARHVDEVPDAR